MLPGSSGTAVVTEIGLPAVTATGKQVAVEAPAGASPSCSSDTWQELAASAAPSKRTAQELSEDARHAEASKASVQHGAAHAVMRLSCKAACLWSVSSAGVCVIC